MKSYRQISRALKDGRPARATSLGEFMRKPTVEIAMMAICFVCDFNAYYTVLNVIFLSESERLVMLLTIGASAITLVAGVLVGTCLVKSIPEGVKRRLGLIKAAVIAFAVACLIAGNLAMRLASENGMILDPTEIDYRAGVFFMIVMVICSFTLAVAMAADEPDEPEDDASTILDEQLDALYLARRQLEVVVGDDEEMRKVKAQDSAKCEAAKAEVDALVDLLKEKARLALLRPCASNAPELIYDADYIEQRPGQKQVVVS